MARRPVVRGENRSQSGGVQQLHSAALEPGAQVALGAPISASAGSSGGPPPAPPSSRHRALASSRSPERRPVAAPVTSRISRATG